MTISSNPCSDRIRQSLPDEYRLLLACARVALDDHQRHHVRQLIRARPDWNRVLLLARRHGICLFLDRSLSELDYAHVPGDVRQQLTTLAANYRRRNLMLVAELLRVVAILDEAGIAVVPYKGPALAQLINGDFALRECVDLDILVKPADAIEARRVLRAAGLRPDRQMSAVAEKLYQAFHCEFAFVVLEEVRLEINWRPAPAYWLLPQPGDGVWTRVRRLRLAGVDTVTPDPADLLIMLCVHASKHKWDTLKWVVDIAELLRSQPDIDWMALRTRANATGAAVMVDIGLLLAEEVLGAPVPTDVAGNARRRSATARLLDEVCEQLFDENAKPCTTLEELPFVAAAAQRPAARIAAYFLMPAYFTLHRLIRPLRDFFSEPLRNQINS